MTRQYVIKSPDSIWKSWPVQKQRIQVPKNAAATVAEREPSSRPKDGQVEDQKGS